MVAGSGISVIVPSRAEGETLLHCIDALSRQGGAGEVIVAARDEPAQVRRRALRCPRLRWVDAPRPGRGAQLNAGADAASGSVLLFLHADTVLPEGAAQAIHHAMRDPGVAGGGFRLTFDASHPALTLLERLSGLSWPCTFLGDQGLFCRRSAFEAAGGYPDEPLFEDVALASRLSHTGTLVRLRCAVRTSARRFVERGPWRQLGLNASLFGLYHCGVPAKRLAGVYRP